MPIRNAAHYRAMLEDHHSARVGTALAAQAVWAARHGAFRTGYAGNDDSDMAFRALARDLLARYGEELSADDVLAEMERVQSREPTVDDFVALRKALGLTARDTSLRLGLHENYASRLERGDVEFRPVYYYALRGLSMDE